MYGSSKSFKGLLRSFNKMHGTRMDIPRKYTELQIRWMERIVEGNLFVIFGTGCQIMDFPDVHDIARATVLAIKSDVNESVQSGEWLRDGPSGTCRDACAGDGSPGPQVGILRRAQGKCGRPRLANTTVASKMWGFGATIRLAEGLADLVTWWRREASRLTAEREKVA